MRVLPIQVFRAPRTIIKALAAWCTFGVFVLSQSTSHNLFQSMEFDYFKHYISPPLDVVRDILTTLFLSDSGLFSYNQAPDQGYNQFSRKQRVDKGSKVKDDSWWKTRLLPWRKTLSTLHFRHC